jgi:hypothetical protein
VNTVSKIITVLSFDDNTVAVFLDESTQCCFGPLISSNDNNAQYIAERFLSYMRARFGCHILGISNEYLSMYYADFKKDVYNEA